MREILLVSIPVGATLEMKYLFTATLLICATVVEIVLEKFPANYATLILSITILHSIEYQTKPNVADKKS